MWCWSGNISKYWSQYRSQTINPLHSLLCCSTLNIYTFNFSMKSGDPNFDLTAALMWRQQPPRHFPISLRRYKYSFRSSCWTFLFKHRWSPQQKQKLTENRGGHVTRKSLNSIQTPPRLWSQWWQITNCLVNTSW